MTTIQLDQVLTIVETIPQEVPSKIAEKVIDKAHHDSVQNIGGFPVTDPLLTQDRLADAKRRQGLSIHKFNTDKMALQEKLAKIGIIEYLSIVPTDYWKNICDRHGLITVEPRLHGGDIKINTTVPWEITEAGKKYWERARDINTTLAFISAGLMIAMLVFQISITAAFFFLGSALVFAPIALALHFIGNWRGKQAIRQHVENTSYDILLRDLLTPNGRQFHWSQDHTASLILPTPPADIVLLLRKLRDGVQGFYVTADPVALRLNPSVETLYMTGYELEKQRIDADNRDPIITVQHGSATAVLAQFGNFKWELEVIEDVISSTPLPTASSSDYD